LINRNNIKYISNLGSLRWFYWNAPILWIKFYSSFNINDV